MGAMIWTIARRFAILLPLAVTLLLSSCSSLPKGEYDCKAYRPVNPSAVVVKVSLSNAMIYVVEGNRLLLATPTTIGTPENPTPKGQFKVFQKIPDKRSNTYGFHASSDTIRPGTRDNTPAGSRYVGYPMPYWVEFSPGYGFHSGCVWPMPRSHGCLRVHKNVAPKFFALAREGTPVLIADHQPEDQTAGRGIPRPTDYADPDPPAAILISDQAFSAPAGPLFEEAPAPLLP
ncbi:MAG: L,D-transpeptidase [Verrucomicrobiales bacterium]